MNLRNPDGALTGKAVWNNDGAGRHQTRLDFELTASDVGRLLTRLGYVDAIRRGTATLAGSMQWNGPLTAIDYPSLAGETVTFRDEMEKDSVRSVLWNYRRVTP